MQNKSPNVLLFPEQQVKFTSHIVKINRRNSAQQRHIVITGQKVYNIKESSVKRAIDTCFIQAFVMSKTSYEFVIRIQGGYDYRFCSPLRWTIYEQIINLSRELVREQPALHLVQEQSLEGYFRNENNPTPKPLNDPVQFEFDNSLNTLISNLLQSDHRVLYIADPHLYEIRPMEIKDLMKMGRATYLIERDHHTEKLVKKVISKSSLPNSTAYTRRYLSEYKQSEYKQIIAFILQNPDSFITFTHCYHHSLIDDVESFVQYSEQQLKKIFYQVVNIVLNENPDRISLENFVYDDIEKIKHTQFECLRPQNLIIMKEELSPQEYHFGRKTQTTALWRMGVLLFKMVYGVSPIQQRGFFQKAKIVHYQQRKIKLNDKLTQLIDELLDFDCQNRMVKYKSKCGKAQHIVTRILRHSWMN